MKKDYAVTTGIKLCFETCVKSDKWKVLDLIWAKCPLGFYQICPQPFDEGQKSEIQNKLFCFLASLPVSFTLCCLVLFVV